MLSSLLWCHIRHQCTFRSYLILRYLYLIVFCSGADLDFEELSTSRHSIEERLVEEYKNSSYANNTREELDYILQEKECFPCTKSRIITYNSPFFHQLRWVLKRTFQNLMLNPQTSVAQVIHR